MNKNIPLGVRYYLLDVLNSVVNSKLLNIFYFHTKLEALYIQRSCTLPRSLTPILIVLETGVTPMPKGWDRPLAGVSSLYLLAQILI